MGLFRRPYIVSTVNNFRHLDLDIVILSEVSQTEKVKYHMISLTCGILKNGRNELIYKTEIESQM